MSLDEDYPKMHRDCLPRLRALLEMVPELASGDREDIVMAINNMADKAVDLNEIFVRMLEGKHTPAEIGELLIAFELTTEQLRGDSDIIDGKLYEIGDRLKELKPTHKN